MADRNSAALFGKLFERLANDEPLDRETLARELWELSQACDFHPVQMGCDEALIKLGLALRTAEADEPIRYGPAADLMEKHFDLRNEVASVLAVMDDLAEQWGDEGQFRRCRDRLRAALRE